MRLFNFVTCFILIFWSMLGVVICDYNSRKNEQELLLCRKCGADVADSYYLFDKLSPGARRIMKQNLFGRKNVTVQYLVNPIGIDFEIITAEKARCETVGSRHGADSWFPGYTWRICACPYCAQHLGWIFEKSSHDVGHDDGVDSFYGIILSNILGENFTDSLLMLPQTYKM